MEDTIVGSFCETRGFFIRFISRVTFGFIRFILRFIIGFISRVTIGFISRIGHI